MGVGEPCSPKGSPRRASCLGCCSWRWDGWRWLPRPRRQISISCPRPPAPPCLLPPCPDQITSRGPGTTSHLFPFTAPPALYGAAAVSPATSLCICAHPHPVFSSVHPHIRQGLPTVCPSVFLTLPPTQQMILDGDSASHPL